MAAADSPFSKAFASLSVASPTPASDLGDNTTSASDAPSPQGSTKTETGSKRSDERLAASSPSLSGRDRGPGRFGGMAEMGFRSDDDEETSPTFASNRAQSQSVFESRSRSHTIPGDPNATLVQMINALAADEQDMSSDEATSDGGSSLQHPGLIDQRSIEESTSEESASEDDKDHPEGEADPQLFNDRRASDASRRTATASKVADTSASPERDPSDEDPTSSFLSVANARERGPTISRGADENMTSSIYAIHRPIAAQRRTFTGEAGEAIKDGVYAHQGEESQSISEDHSDEEHDEHSSNLDQGAALIKTRSSRSSTVVSGGSVARKKQLADKLTDIFGLLDSEEVIAEYPCWLFRSVLLQGFLYLTSGHICFYAYLQAKEGAVIRSGGLSVRTARTRRYYKHWFILKDSVLSWYPSSTDPFFPDGHIDLHYCTSVESSKHATHFKVATAEKRWHFSADSEASRDEWVKTLKKAVFRCQNEGESVKICIPLETVVDIEFSNNLEFAETIRVRVYDSNEGYALDDYWLAYFSDIHLALDKMKEVLETFRKAHPERLLYGEPQSIADTTVEAAAAAAGDKLEEQTTNASGLSRISLQHRQGSWSTMRSSRLRLFPSSNHSDRPSPSPLSPADSRGSQTSAQTTMSPTRGLSSESSDSDHRYPPYPSPNASVESAKSPHNWSLPSLSSVSSWVKAPPRLLLQAATSPSLRNASNNKNPCRKIVETISRGPKSASSLGPEADYSLGLEHQETEDASNADEDDEDEKRDERVRKAFGLSEKEHTLAHFSGFLYRGVPIYGKMYITTSFLCFRSISLLAHAKMCLPLAEVIGVSHHRSYRIGYSGMVVTIKGHEELFFELHTSKRRDTCMQAIESQVEFIRKELSEGKTPGDTLAYREHLTLMDLAASKASDSSEPRPQSESKEGQPPVMFNSTTSDFVTFKPEKSLKFTCMTIGSRGDVQPYIALCKGLKAEGHKVKIATHGEFKEWVEGHGIEHEEIGGDPAELMQLMIAHDFFTIAFMKEAVGKFRGWLDDLLETAWKACQGADVLIESPSTFAGYHVAEALRIPYYRAFTMPWSRTRAYPHAFAVPDHKMGGSYNYMTYTMFDQIFWRATASQINRWRRKTLKLGPTSLEAMQQHKIPFLYNNSPVIMPPPLDWRENIHVTGYWILDNPDDSSSSRWEPPQDLLDFMNEAKEKNKKIVFIGFGSIIIPDPEGMTRTITAAVQKAGVYAIVAKGWSERAASKHDSEEEKQRLKEQEKKQAEVLNKPFIYKIKSIPHDWLFPKIHAAVHHGGAGTTGASLRAGLPTIIKPWFGDQHFYADRVQTLGVGTAVRHLTVETLASAIHKAVTDEKQIDRAKLAGQQIRKEDGVGTAIECIYRDLEYAKSLIPPPPHVSKRKSTDSAGHQDVIARKADQTAKSSPINPSSSDEASWDVVSGGGSGSASGRGERWDDDEMSELGSTPTKSRGASETRHPSDQGSVPAPIALTTKVLESLGVTSYGSSPKLEAVAGTGP
ncbi:BZ3500_MvSof-1268-A1-R1_Chr5-2g08087 [Microbotryum saponariae]|uniref:Sterol 3-beta-glucosyltransferase n=1 Tax=Microbotryum saponariae TaxID=289078 RepID=A0A2X0NJI3_9BASI|nr:BZ3500_MvSof-1268-A1-R1_Chr5-2g08087 [Microbotryum saponariae]SDA05956.1 BZ3501_MvSof-1269-A2-R1_Chr5-2g07909 [Microbotryum saponariae]